ncbi:MAG: aspartate carbamoyltransferase regulatory subunit [Oscillospiraceae bacterium]|nr:aspartate carbamoyltransferase regulatory subunit [Oscillospiraceae bacterium]MDD7355316.1 aspartate carbamoyltransferase regulatory subunit [Oscillospiraceae bacterium]MDY3938139.1 aspartate carbamoyltransferase regulatory subunit [Oscillospiraceae bacterium]
MNIDSIKNGFVIDHIPAGKAMEIYKLLSLDKLSCPVAMIMNAVSRRMGRKDMIKIDADIDIDTDVIGYITPGATVNVIKNSERVDKRTLSLPDTLTNVIFCKNPRCISSCEQQLPAVFKLTDRKNKVYRCYYCDAKHTDY